MKYKIGDLVLHEPSNDVGIVIMGIVTRKVNYKEYDIVWAYWFGTKEEQWTRISYVTKLN